VDALDRFATNLRAERERRGLTQERLAELADLHMTDVGRIERAERDPGVRTVAKLAAGLGIPASRLFEGVPEDSLQLEGA
jgi:transcriptional regulator with XRE-family HTH domain